MQLLVRGEVAALPLKGIIDVAAEQARLHKEIAKADADIKRVDAKLGNPDSSRKAPEEIIEGEKEKREEAEGRRAKILEALERLKDAASDLRRIATAACLRSDKAIQVREAAMADEARNVEVLKLPMPAGATPRAAASTTG